ncbi:hypothetical protein E2C01_014939 [Portunus trituberculatus]|uniref:Uncharacterized protein n=1 Tax=Portunus trituberculatus TaxID=210409 RepID=A0A5B7DLT2_PORTR|nr:hypothetical protein [Portunus trituberculatus]
MDSPMSEPLELNPTSSPSTSSGAGILVAKGTTVILAILVLILHSFSKALTWATSLLLRAFSLSIALSCSA